MNNKFDYVMIVGSIKEAEYKAKEMGLTINDFRYCTRQSDIVGYKLPTDKMLFISEDLDNEMTYLDGKGNLYTRLEDRFHTIIDIYERKLNRK